MIEPDDRVGEVMRLYPETVRVFLRHRLHCPGCAFASFCTIEETCAAYGIPLARVLADLRAAAASGPPGLEPAPGTEGAAESGSTER